MKRWLETLTFLTLAVALHLVVLASPPKSGIAAGGSGGDAMVSLKAAAPTVAEMVEAWERPPAVQTDIRPEITPPSAAATKAPTMPDLKIDQAPRAQVKVALAKPQKDRDVQIDTTPPPPPAPPKAQAKPKPDVAPKQRPPKKPKQQGHKAKVTSAGVAKQVSAGSGGAAQAGAGSARVSTASAGQTAKLQAVWGAKIRARIERNKRYPRGSRAKGDVTIQLTVTRGGKLMSHRLVKSSGDAKLDQAALSAVQRTPKLPKAPKELGGDSFRFSLMIRMMPRR
ncbi:energy transducer TonB [Ruegeria halocynthiae]|uniref:energy transducer TonB n=1 Tax=Ruegeria halocynthiae TaxID=985054 RepID=UPI0005659117|nr:energy transducer TonB [Ruegeria halocynthiae]